MAEIIIDSMDSTRNEKPEQIPYITDEIAEAAANVHKSADELFEATKPYANIPYVKKIDDTVKSALPAVYPVAVGTPTGPYIDVLLEKRKELEALEVSIRAGEIPVKPEDEEGATTAANWWQRFSLMYMCVLFHFEAGLTPEQHW